MKYAIFILMILVFASCVKNGKMECHDPIKPTHSGKILEISDCIGHVEFVYNAEKGAVSLYILDMMGKSMTVEESPIFNVLTKTGKDKNYKIIRTSSIDPNQKKLDAFFVKDKIFVMNDSRGFIQLKIEGQFYQIEYKIVKYTRPSQRRGNHQYENWFVVY